MLVERSMQPDWLSNAYVVADREGGTAVFVDAGADIAPLVAAVEEWEATPAAILRTHSHHDHIAHEHELRARYDVPVIAEPGEWEWGGLRVRGVATPGHSDDMVAFVVGDEAVFTGDTLFLDAVGGGNSDQVRASVMDVFMSFPDNMRVLPGHTDETTLAREWEENPFVRVWRGVEPEGSEPCSVGGEPATLIVWSPDY
ncbi:MAG TPA: MBL fold metallo-hydrolase, partial [Gaiellaceae bacterium]|nr:MBL fold metallo-hydrolase [Gaiellaceae bacterium]